MVLQGVLMLGFSALRMARNALSFFSMGAGEPSLTNPAEDANGSTDRAMSVAVVSFAMPMRKQPRSLACWITPSKRKKDTALTSRMVRYSSPLSARGWRVRENTSPAYRRESEITRSQ